VVDAIASIQRQTRPVDEIIVVDDGSTDATPDAVAHLSRQDGRIRLVALSKSAGASAARNVGINSTECDWISFLDSDDQWMARKHEIQCEAIANCPDDAVASFTGIRYEYSDHYYDVPAPAQIPFQELLGHNHLGSTSTAMVRRQALRQIGGFDPTLPSCQDWDLWIRLRRIGEFAIVPDPLVLFNQTERVRISSHKADVLAGHRQLFIRALKEVANKQERRIISAHHQARLAHIYLIDFNEPVSALFAATRSLLSCRTQKGANLLKGALRETLRRIGHYAKSAH
jgi:glycosyltransferase involved in cell wall biosynthesis